ncbi:hypothetical protein BOTBODRAFT_186414 [Botryobasidium botryosum FD-172 SS1]|uniref:F-box domain-containing protein n=1 Tax=Botryobasidium botryosum (strain FD-172 SS1) TaxID=930990 RepID=A0A067MZ31_BOTB1|nr:hypothetical protein BOTBODRAFT_186414 [Botryobasidium botryosum FD-172 SS1]
MTRYILSRLVIPPSARMDFGRHNSNMLAILPSHDHIQTNLPALSSAVALLVGSMDPIRYYACGYTCEQERLFELQLPWRLGLPGILADLRAALPTPSVESISLCHLTDTPAGVTAVADLLARHPLVTQLEYKGCSGSMIQILLDTSVCPRLESLRISKSPLNPDALVDIARLRTRPKGLATHGLTRLMMKECPQLEPVLSALRGHGVDVEYE